MEIKNEEKYIPEKRESVGIKDDKENSSFFVKIRPVIKIVAVMAAGFFVGFEIGYFTYYAYLPYKMPADYIKKMSPMIKPYVDDEFGGNTPEETIDLFIEALKKEDYELAVKYFEIREQPRWIESFKKPNKENINKWIKELEDNKNSWHKEQKDENTFEFWYNTGEGEKEITNSIYVRKNFNNKWKIEGF